MVRHVVWALPDPSAAIERWAACLRPGGRLVLIEGRWSTGGGLPPAELAALVRPWVAELRAEALVEDDLWGRPIEDERYVVLAHL